MDGSANTRTWRYPVGYKQPGTSWNLQSQSEHRSGIFTMTNHRMIEFDHDLCEYILGRICTALRLLFKRTEVIQPLDYQQWHQLGLATWLGPGTVALSTNLVNHLWAGVVGEPVPRSLNETELNALEPPVNDPPLLCEDETV